MTRPGRASIAGGSAPPPLVVHKPCLSPMACRVVACVVQVGTGRLLRSWAAHYKAVTSLRLSDDDSLLISASDDASIHVTPLIR